MIFRQQVLQFIAAVPKGKVVSYGQVAAACGRPRAARVVGGILRGLKEKEYKKVPWWRVVNNQGFLSIKGNWTASKETQAQLLRREKVKVGKNFTLDMGKYRYGGSKTFNS